MRLICTAGLAISLLWAPRAFAQTTVASTFGSTTEGWTPVNDGAMYWSDTDGIAGGYLKGVDQQLGAIWYFGVPPKFLGDKSQAYGQTLEYVIRQSAKSADVNGEADVVLSGAGISLVLTYAPPGTDWTSVSVRLDETGGWRKGALDGPEPTAAEVKAVLEDLTALRIRGEYSSDWDRADLDDVVMHLAAPAVRRLPALSGFDQDAEGWLARGDMLGVARQPTWDAVGGSPGGCISSADVETDIWYFVAPLKFLGDMSSAYGRELRWDMRQAETDAQFTAPDVILTGEDLELFLDAGASPGSGWTSYKVRLDAASPWRVASANGALATEQQIQKALAALTAVRIRGEYRTGTDTAWLDNVAFGAGSMLYGDANADERVDMQDVLIALRGAAGLQMAARTMGLDVAPKPSLAPSGFGNGHLDVGDALRILRLVTGCEPSLP